MEKLNFDITELSESEKQAIWKVLKRDEELRKRDEQRVNRLKSELQCMRRRGAIRGDSDPMNSCSRCRCELGKIINRGAQCNMCNGKVCKSCRHFTKDGALWICVVCHKQLELEAATGEWMNEFVRRASKRKDKKSFVPPADIVKDIIIQHQSESSSEHISNVYKNSLGNPRYRTLSHSPENRHRPSSTRSTATQFKISTNDSSTITSEEDLLENVHFLSNRFSAIENQNESVNVDGDIALPVPAPRAFVKPLAEKVELIMRSDSITVSKESETIATGRQKRQAPSPPGASTKTYLPPPPPPPYRSHHIGSGERSDSGISQDNQHSPKSSRSESSAQSFLSDRPKCDLPSQSSQIESESITGDTASSDMDSELDLSSGVVFRKVTLKRRKKTPNKSRPLAVNNESSISDRQSSAKNRMSMPPQPRPRSVATIQISNSEKSSMKSPPSLNSGIGSAKELITPLMPNKTSSASSGNSPKADRDVHSWPDESGNFIKMSSKGPNFVTTQRKPASVSEAVLPSRYGTTLSPTTIVDDNSDKGSRLGGSGAGSHTGSSEHDNFLEEDIDRLVALHNRSISSLGACSESMTSLYSAAGGGSYGNVVVRGEIEFGLSYNYMAGALEVNIKQCKELAAVDTKRNRSDPYVKAYLLPDKSKNGKRKTKIKKHTLNPMFNEILKFHVTISELETRTLWVTVWHSDMFGRNEFLGEVTLPMGYEAWEDTTLKWYLLEEKLGSPEDVFTYKGDIVVALKFVPQDVASLKKGKGCKGCLCVLVKEARNLMAVSATGTSDPFCKCYLLPIKGKNSKLKSNVIKRTCNPKWNHTFVYEDIGIDEVRERGLELTVWDYDRLTSNDFLGGIRLSDGEGKRNGLKVEWMDSKGEEIKLWQAMLEKPNVWVEGTIMLRPSMDPRPSWLPTLAATSETVINQKKRLSELLGDPSMALPKPEQLTSKVEMRQQKTNAKTFPDNILIIVR